jgi:hypothetical protein
MFNKGHDYTGTIYSWYIENYMWTLTLNCPW